MKKHLKSRHIRPDRIATAIHEAFSSIVVKSEYIVPSLSNISMSVTHVQVTADLSSATIFLMLHQYANRDAKNSACFSVYSKKILKELNEGAHIFRKMLANTLKMRKIPEIRFAIDRMLNAEAEVLGIIDSVSVQRWPIACAQYLLHGCNIFNMLKAVRNIPLRHILRILCISINLLLPI